MKINSNTTESHLYDKVRAAFIVQGTTLSAWCRGHNIKQTHAKSSLYGSWNGPKGSELRKQLIKESRVESLVN